MPRPRNGNTNTFPPGKADTLISLQLLHPSCERRSAGRDGASKLERRNYAVVDEAVYLAASDPQEIGDSVRAHQQISLCELLFVAGLAGDAGIGAHCRSSVLIARVRLFHDRIAARSPGVFSLSVSWHLEGPFALQSLQKT